MHSHGVTNRDAPVEGQTPSHVPVAYRMNTSRTVWMTVNNTVDTLMSVNTKMRDDSMLTTTSAKCFCSGCEERETAHKVIKTERNGKAYAFRGQRFTKRLKIRS